METLGYDYGQRHVVELAVRGGLLALACDALESALGPARLGEDHVLTLATLGRRCPRPRSRGNVAITVAASGLPSTFVPGRNLLFFTYAAALGYRRGLRHIVGGMCETDYSGYPDCRDDTIKAMQVALSLGLEQRFVLHTPLMWRDKAATWRLAASAGRRGAGAADRGAHAQLLPGRPRAPPRLGLRLRRLPGLRAKGQRLEKLLGAAPSTPSYTGEGRGERATVFANALLLCALGPHPDPARR